MVSLQFVLEKRKVGLGVSDQERLKSPCIATETSLRLEILITEKRCILQSKQLNIKAMVRLHRYFIDMKINIQSNTDYRHSYFSIIR